MTFTPQQYLELERDARDKSEYLNGEIVERAASSPDHARISGNLLARLWLQLRKSRFEVLNSDMRIAVDPASVYTYADLLVVYEPVFVDSDNVANPCVIFEVLSPSTEDYDHGEKFENYKRIATLTDYVLVSHDSPFIEHHRREEGDRWETREYSGWDAALRLDSIQCVLPLADIYDRVLQKP